MGKVNRTYAVNAACRSLYKLHPSLDRAGSNGSEFRDRDNMKDVSKKMLHILAMHLKISSIGEEFVR